MTLDAFSTIVRPVVSEKSTVLGDEGKYIFEVAPDGQQDPDQARRRRGVRQQEGRRSPRSTSCTCPASSAAAARSVGMTRSWKKAIVTLRAGQRLDLFEGV